MGGNLSIGGGGGSPVSGTAEVHIRGLINGKVISKKFANFEV